METFTGSFFFFDLELKRLELKRPGPASRILWHIWWFRLMTHLLKKGGRPRDIPGEGLLNA